MFSFLKGHKPLKSFSQTGEDLIVNFIKDAIHLKDFSYLDLGANHPLKYSNTAFFYKMGYSGVCVEADPLLCKKFKSLRPKDKVLNIGVGIHDQKSMEFFVMTSSTLNTFSEKEALRYSSYGNEKIEEKIKVDVKTVNNIISENFESYPNFISLDVEGLDYEIIKSLNFKKFPSQILCIETLSYTQNKKERKIKEIIDAVIDNGYMLFADTYINSIFVKKTVWENR